VLALAQTPDAGRARAIDTQDADKPPSLSERQIMDALTAVSIRLGTKTFSEDAYRDELEKMRKEGIKVDELRMPSEQQIARAMKRKLRQQANAFPLRARMREEVPLADSRPLEVVETGLPEPPAARPLFLGEGQLAVPIENIGTGPALRVEASVQVRNPDGGPTAVGTGGMKPAVLAGIKASGSVAPIIKIHGLADVPGFQLTLTYEDVAGKGWLTQALYIATERRYADVTINTQEEGAYGLRRDRELVKPV
jgi:hypothetical protein